MVTGTRASPITYFKLALTSDAPWNYSRWKNPEFDKLVSEIPLALEEAERADLYKQAQALLQEQVPVMNFIILTGVAGESANVEGIELDQVLRWLTGHTQKSLEAALKTGVTFGEFFDKAPAMNPARAGVTGVICGVRIEEIDHPTMREIRILDKLVDELAKGRPMEKVLRG